MPHPLAPVSRGSSPTRRCWWWHRFGFPSRRPSSARSRRASGSIFRSRISSYSGRARDRRNGRPNDEKRDAAAPCLRRRARELHRRAHMRDDDNLTAERPTFVTHLECSATGARYPSDELRNLSRERKPLLVRSDVEAIRKALRKEALALRRRDLSRYH